MLPDNKICFWPMITARKSGVHLSCQFFWEWSKKLRTKCLLFFHLGYFLLSFLCLPLQCCLAAIIVVALRGMFRQLTDIKKLWKYSKIDMVSIVSLWENIAPDEVMHFMYCLMPVNMCLFMYSKVDLDVYIRVNLLCFMWCKMMKHQNGKTTSFIHALHRILVKLKRSQFNLPLRVKLFSSKEEVISIKSRTDAN